MTVVRSELSDIVNAINQEVQVIENSITDLEQILQEDPDIANSIAEESKFRRFAQGLFVIRRILELQITNIKVAEIQEDDDLQIEIEALKLETETCLITIEEKIEKLR